MDKKFGVIPIVLCLCFAVFLAVGDNPVIAANNTTQTAQVTVANVISITVPAVICNYVNETNVPLGMTNLELLQGNYTNTSGHNVITSQSNGKIDVYMKSSTGNIIWNNNATLTYPDTLNNFRYTAIPAGSTTFTTSFQMAVNNWKVSQGGGNNTAQVPVYVDVPSYTAPGEYLSTITYAAVRNGVTAPTW